MASTDTPAVPRPAPRTAAANSSASDLDPAHSPFHELRNRWFRALRASNRSPETLESYKNITNDLYATRDKPVRPGTLAIRFRSLAAFFNWASRDDEDHIQYLRRNPMAHMKRPTVPEDPPPVLEEAAIQKLLDTCRGRSFEDRRDRAIFLMLRWSGMRLGELISLRYEADTMDLEARQARITGKTGSRLTKWTPEAATALDGYLFERESHPDATRPELWLGRRGPMTKHAVQQMIRRRAAKAGVRAHAHQFRHTLASNGMEDRQGDEQNLSALLGWSAGSAPVMLRRYGGAERQRRALDAYDQFAATRREKVRRQ
jgi:site-specific recombinase XerC